MIPLGYLLFAWAALLALYGLLALITIVQAIKHGPPDFFTYASTFAFLAVIAAVILGSGSYFLTVDWSERISVIPAGLTGSPAAPIDIPLDQ